jgi:tetratricopeptide (TPR) repeat protein
MEQIRDAHSKTKSNKAHLHMSNNFTYSSPKLNRIAADCAVNRTPTRERIIVRAVGALLLLVFMCAPSLGQSEKEAASLDATANKAALKGDYKAEEKYYRQALTVRQKCLKKTDARVIKNMEILAVACREEKKYAEAETLYDQALSLWRSAAPPAVPDKEHDAIADNREGLAIVLTDAGKFSRAADMYKQAVAHREQTLGPKDLGLALSLRAYAEVLAKLNRITEAKAAVSKADKIMPPLCGNPALAGPNGSKLPPPPMLIPKPSH